MGVKNGSNIRACVFLVHAAAVVADGKLDVVPGLCGRMACGVLFVEIHVAGFLKLRAFCLGELALGDVARGSSTIRTLSVSRIRLPPPGRDELLVSAPASGR
jgi:hypothetical protein